MIQSAQRDERLLARLLALIVREGNSQSLVVNEQHDHHSDIETSNGSGEAGQAHPLTTADNTSTTLSSAAAAASGYPGSTTPQSQQVLPGLHSDPSQSVHATNNATVEAAAAALALFPSQSALNPSGRPEIPRTSDVKEAISQWFRPGPDPAHVYALRDWPKEWYSKGRTIHDLSVQSLYLQRNRLADAYRAVNGGLDEFTDQGWDAFRQKYPHTTLTAVVKAIKQELMDAGKITSRRRKHRVREESTIGQSQALQSEIVEQAQSFGHHQPSEPKDTENDIEPNLQTDPTLQTDELEHTDHMDQT